MVNQLFSVFAALESNPLMTGEHENQRREFFTYPVVHFLISMQVGGENLSHMCVFGGGGVGHVSLYDRPRERHGC